MPIFSSLFNEWFLAFAINFLLIGFAQRIPLLTPTGWAHAGILGTVLLGTLGWGGWLSVVMYLLLGSAVTKLGWERKRSAGIAEKRGGRRGPENLWGSAATGFFIALLIGAGLGDVDLLLLGFSASFAAKLADTFGSEIGKRWGTKTVLITSFKPVKPGTDGAISLVGTCASATGSLVMTFMMVIFSIIDFGLPAIIVSISGLLATLFESFLGALFQNKISFLNNELINFLQTTFAAVFAMLVFSIFN